MVSLTGSKYAAHYIVRNILLKWSLIKGPLILSTITFQVHLCKMIQYTVSKRAFYLRKRSLSL